MKHLYVGKFSHREGFQRVFFIYFLFFSIIITAQTYPETVQLNNVQYESYQTPTGPKPGYLQETTNEFGNKLTRISDAAVFGTTDFNVRHHYSLDEPWNSDGSLIKLAGYPAAILDADTYEFLYWAGIPSSATWSYSEPNIMYGISGNRFVSYDVTTNNRQTIRTFSDYSVIEYGGSKGNMSIDDKYVGLIGRNGSNRTLIVYDVENDVVVATRNIGTAAIGWFSVSQSGQYAVSCYLADGSADDQGMKVFNIDLTNRRHLDDYTKHGDLGIDANGNDVYVTFGDPVTRGNDYYMKMIRLSDGVQTPLFHYTSDYGVWNGHISCRNTSRPGWAYVNEGCCQTVGRKEVFAIKLDGSDMIQRFAYHHTNENTGYAHQAHAVPNRDGSKVMFASNWNNQFTEAHPPSFVVEAPATLGIEENEAVASNNIKVYPNPSRDGMVHIKLNGNIAVKSIQLYDMLGRTIRTEEMVSKEKSLNLSHLPVGVYLLSFQTENNGSVTKRIVLN
ncbi:T9SS type A sorting domain-containing protein [Xanthomarina gelatinilytica]|uniref:T9SS type A sorting domain-containing protein n=1 Tax=Xanthomarina gelatinilytica TaxID=1137281 RepID=UPI003510D620